MQHFLAYKMARKKLKHKNEYYNIVSLLWADIRVKNTLDTSNVELFNKLKQMEIKTKVKQF